MCWAISMNNPGDASQTNPNSPPAVASPALSTPSAALCTCTHSPSPHPAFPCIYSAFLYLEKQGIAVLAVDGLLHALGVGAKQVVTHNLQGVAGGGWVPHAHPQKYQWRRSYLTRGYRMRCRRRRCDV